MRALLSAMGRAFLRAFAASAVIMGVGVLSAPNLDSMYALAVAALIASISAGLKAIQVFVPKLAVGGNYGEILTVSIQAGLSAFLVSVIGILDAPEFGVTRSLLIGVVVAVGTAVLRALQGFLSTGEEPSPGNGF